MWSSFMIYADCEYNMKEIWKIIRNNPNESYNAGNEDTIACSCWYILVCVHGRFSKPVQKYEGESKNYKFNFLLFTCLIF